MLFTKFNMCSVLTYHFRMMTFDAVIVFIIQINATVFRDFANSCWKIDKNSCWKTVTVENWRNKFLVSYAFCMYEKTIATRCFANHWFFRMLPIFSATAKYMQWGLFLTVSCAWYSQFIFLLSFYRATPNRCVNGQLLPSENQLAIALLTDEVPKHNWSSETVWSCLKCFDFVELSRSFPSLAFTNVLLNCTKKYFRFPSGHD